MPKRGNVPNIMCTISRALYGLSVRIESIDLGLGQTTESKPAEIEVMLCVIYARDVRKLP